MSHSPSAAGEGGRFVTLLHGAGMDHTVWRFQTRRLSGRGWRPLAVDLPGHGRSEASPSLSVGEAADRLEDLLAERPGAVVGHSLGALIALEVAARRPDLITDLALVGAGVRMPVHPVLTSAARDDLPRAARFIAGWSLPPAHPGGHPEPGTWERGAIVRLVERSRPGVLAADLIASAGYDAGDRLTAVRANTLVVRGDADRMVAATATRALAEGIHAARLVFVAGAGHQPMLQQPGTFNRILDEFLETGGGPGRHAA